MKYSRLLSPVLALALIVSLLTGCGSGTGGSTWQDQYDLGMLYLSEGNYEEAIIAFTAAIEIDPKRPRPMKRRLRPTRPWGTWTPPGRYWSRGSKPPVTAVCWSASRRSSHSPAIPGRTGLTMRTGVTPCGSMIKRALCFPTRSMGRTALRYAPCIPTPRGLPAPGEHGGAGSVDPGGNTADF